MKDIILKWYEKLNLPGEWLEKVSTAAESFDPSELDCADDPYMQLSGQEDKMLCLLYALYKCEDFFAAARKRNIPEDILIASLSEVRRYAVEYNGMTKGEKIGILQINWIGKILKGNIYRLGRLEFEIRPCARTSEMLGVKEGDNVVAVHIPDNGGPLTPEACTEAYGLAEAFFAKYFPEYEYKCYTCFSWLLDVNLKKFLKPTSNIVKFMDSFKIDDNPKETPAALIYLFGRGTTEEDLKNITPTTGLQKGVIDHVLGGGKLYQGFGVRSRQGGNKLMEKIVLKWFDRLNFPADWKPAVREALKTFDLETVKKQEAPYNWLNEQEDKMMGMLYALYMCEDFFNKGLEKGIPEDILIETMQEVRRHSQNYYRSSKGEKLGIYSIRWVGTVLSGKLYCLGRLEFEMKTTKKTCEALGVVPGDRVMGVHIPRTGGPMSNEEVEESLKTASEFFPKYFPDFDYKCYMCHSWLLDPTLRKLLKPESNIIKFMNRFEITEVSETLSGLGIIFGAGTTYENVLAKTPETSLQKAAYEHIKNGGRLYEAFGFMAK